jgi:hypothetical protein
VGKGDVAMQDLPPNSQRVRSPLGGEILNPAIPELRGWDGAAIARGEIYETTCECCKAARTTT